MKITIIWKVLELRSFLFFVCFSSSSLLKFGTLNPDFNLKDIMWPLFVYICLNALVSLIAVKPITISSWHTMLSSFHSLVKNRHYSETGTKTVHLSITIRVRVCKKKHLLSIVSTVSNY